MSERIAICTSFIYDSEQKEKATYILEEHGLNIVAHGDYPTGPIFGYCKAGWAPNQELYEFFGWNLEGLDELAKLTIDGPYFWLYAAGDCGDYGWVIRFAKGEYQKVSINADEQTGSLFIRIGSD